MFRMRRNDPTNDWYKATQLGDALNNPDPKPLRIQNPVNHLDHAKREVVAARYFDIPADAIETAGRIGG